MSSNIVPAKSGQSRVFLIEGQGRPDHAPSYESLMNAGEVSQGLGDVTSIEAPDPNKRGAFVDIGEIQDANERPTTSLTGRYAADLASTLVKLARKRCAVDLIVPFGACSDPSILGTGTKWVMFEKAHLTNISIDQLGALESGDRSPINESVDISASEFYEVVNLSYSERGGSVVTNEVVAVALCDSSSCGDCDDESDGCKKMYAVTVAAGGSPSTPADLLYSEDGGVNWYAYDIDSLASTIDASDVGCLGTNLIVLANASAGLHWAALNTIKTNQSPDFAVVTTGFVTNGEPNALSVAGNKAFIVGDGGYIYTTTDITGGVTVIDAGSAVSDDLTAIHAISSDFAVGVGLNSTIVKITGGDTATSVTAPTGAGIDYNTIFLKSEKVWFIGTSNGKLYYTVDGGTNWTEKTFSGSGAGEVRAVAFMNNLVGFMSHDTATPKGRILKTIDGGYSWNVEPSGVGVLPANDRINDFAVCENDPNLVVGVGLADDASDGFILLGAE